MHGCRAHASRMRGMRSQAARESTRRVRGRREQTGGDEQMKRQAEHVMMHREMKKPVELVQLTMYVMTHAIGRLLSYR